jgi:hypothetical protein
LAFALLCVSSVTENLGDEPLTITPLETPLFPSPGIKFYMRKWYMFSVFLKVAPQCADFCSFRVTPSWQSLSDHFQIRRRFIVSLLFSHVAIALGIDYFHKVAGQLI